MSQLDGAHDDTIVYTGVAARARLAELGLVLDVLEAALDSGDVAARQADEFSPVTAAGTYRWMETVHGLREGLASHGWTCSDDRNSPRVIDPTGRVAVLAARGTPDTGLVDGDPKTARPRGGASIRAVQINGQLAFDVVVAQLADLAAERARGVNTWFLLYFRSESDELRAEVSLPVRISDTGFVEKWAERILLEPRSFDAARPLPRDAGGGDDVEFDLAAR